MSHEPECGMPWMPCICASLRAAYRRGYNAHAASRAHAEAMHGTYPMGDRLGTFDRSRWNQHGKGENP